LKPIFTTCKSRFKFQNPKIKRKSINLKPCIPSLSRIKKIWAPPLLPGLCFSLPFFVFPPLDLRFCFSFSFLRWICLFLLV
jgi:hypothetical protein